MIETHIRTMRRHRFRCSDCSCHHRVHRQHYDEYVSELYLWRRSEEVHCSTLEGCRRGEQFQTSFSFRSFEIPWTCSKAAYRLTDVICNVESVLISPQGIVLASFSRWSSRLWVMPLFENALSLKDCHNCSEAAVNSLCSDQEFLPSIWEPDRLSFIRVVI